jgi:hypothetical protein
MNAAGWVLVGLVVLAWMKYRRYVERRQQRIEDARRVFVAHQMLKEKHS